MDRTAWFQFGGLGRIFNFLFLFIGLGTQAHNSRCDLNLKLLVCVFLWCWISRGFRVFVVDYLYAAWIVLLHEQRIRILNYHYCISIASYRRRKHVKDCTFPAIFYGSWFEFWASVFRLLLNCSFVNDTMLGFLGFCCFSLWDFCHSIWFVGSIMSVRKN